MPQREFEQYVRHVVRETGDTSLLEPDFEAMAESQAERFFDPQAAEGRYEASIYGRGL